MALQSHLKFLLLFASTLGICQEANEQEANEQEVSEPAKTFDRTPIQDENFIKEDKSEYLPRLSVGGFYHNRDHLFGEFDLLLPFIQTDNFLLFGNLRGLDYKGGKGEINLGLGMRVLCQHWLFGIYSYYDRKRSEHRKLFNQITAGIEAKTRRFTFDANAYIPFGKTRQREKEFDKVELRDGDNNFKNIWYVRGQEVALWGLDGEVGYNFWKWFSLFAGGFYFDRKDVPSLAGPMGRIEAIIDTYKPKTFFIFDRIQLEAGMTYDHIRKTRAYGGIRISWDLGDRNKVRNKGLRKRMTEYVRRDFNVTVAGDDDQPLQRLNNPDGSAVTVRLVSNDAQLDQAITDKAQVLGVEGTITALNRKTPLISVAVTGGIYQFLGDMQIRLSDFGKFSYANDFLFGLNGGVYSFRDLSFLSLDPNAALAIFNNEQIEDILVDNCQFKNATITLTGVNHDSSKITVTNNTFNLDSITTGRQPLTFDLSAIAPASLNIALIQNNAFTTDLMETSTSFVMFKTNDAFSGNIQVGDIVQNTFLCKEAQLKEVRGIFIINEKISATPVDQSITVRSISNNTFEFLATGNKEDCRVIYLTNLGGSDFSTQSIYVQNMNSNLIKMQNYTKARGIELLLGQTSDFAKQSIQVDHILHNDITYDGTDSHGVLIFSGFPASTTKDSTVVIGQNGGFFDNHFHTTPTTGFVDIFIKNLNADPSNTIDVFVHDGGKGLSEANNGAKVATEGPNINITP